MPIMSVRLVSLPIGRAFRAEVNVEVNVEMLIPSFYGGSSGDVVLDLVR